MTFSERLALHPMSAVSACFIWIPIAVWVISMIGWMVSGEVETVYGIFAVGFGIGLGLVAAFPPYPETSVLLFGVSIAMVVIYPFARSAVNRRALAAIEVEQIEKYYEAIRLRPDNAPAMMKLAELLFLRGLHGHGIALAERALPSMPQNLFRPEHNMVSAWKMSTSHEHDLFKPVACLECGVPNPPGELHCQNCGAPYIIDMAKGKWLGKGTAQQFIVAWVGLGIAFVGIPLAARTASVSPLLAIALILAQGAFGGFLVYKVFITRGRHETT